MPKARVSSPKSRPRRSPSLNEDVSHWLHKSLRRHHFVGISLGGGKTDKTCLAFIEYYPKHNKLFLHRLQEKVQSLGETSADEVLFKFLKGQKPQPKAVAVNVPLTLPKCLRCRLECPGYEKCSEPEILWLWKHYRERNVKKKPQKLFTPYTERCVEYYISSQVEETFHPPHALGSNVAPLTARALFLKRRLKSAFIEVYPKLSLWRIGCALGIQKSYLRTHKHSFGGQEARQAILSLLIEKDIAFIYDQDFKAMVERPEPFEAFLCALTALLKFKNQVEPRPKGFPGTEGWVAIPKVDITW